MTEGASGTKVEAVRGRIDTGLEGELIEFWAQNGALDEDAARRRLPEVLAVARDSGGAITGVNSAYADAVPLLGGRTLWILRSFVLEVAEPARDEMVRVAFEILGEGFDPFGDAPIGLCLLLDEGTEQSRRPEAEWSDPRTIYAGYLPDGRQVRVAYFPEAAIAAGDHGVMKNWELDPGITIRPFGDAGDVSDADVIALWEREGAVTGEEARRRVSEVHLVATHETDGLIGISSAYLQRNEQLRTAMWHYRAFVSSAHRIGNTAVQLALQGPALLREGFTSGADTRAPGVIFEVENPGLKRYFNRALWLPTDFLFIGENSRGDHVRVQWFPGAEAPGP